MKYKCLVLDHDDTVVDSTASIHYPCFVDYLKMRRPEEAGKCDLSTYFLKNFHPGILRWFFDEYRFTKEEYEEEDAFWREYVRTRVPHVYPGMREIITEFRTRGGIIAVDSHSYADFIGRDYRENGLPLPDVIYGWELPPEERKPSPYTLFRLMRDFHLSPEEILVVDDLKPGFDMARAAGVDFAAAGWAYDVPEIEAFMRKNCKYYCKTVADLGKILFG